MQCVPSRNFAIPSISLDVSITMHLKKIANHFHNPNSLNPPTI